MVSRAIIRDASLVKTSSISGWLDVECVIAVKLRDAAVRCVMRRDGARVKCWLYRVRLLLGDR